MPVIKKIDYLVIILLNFTTPQIKRNLIFSIAKMVDEMSQGLPSHLKVH